MNTNWLKKNVILFKSWAELSKKLKNCVNQCLDPCTKVHFDKISSNHNLHTKSKDAHCSRLGPLHVLWQASFGCWVTWSISSWQKYYKRVFFPKAEWLVAELLSLKSEAITLFKMNAVNPLRFTSHQKNWEKCLLLNLENFWMIKSTKTSILSFFGITVNFITQTQLWEKKTLL